MIKRNHKSYRCQLLTLFEQNDESHIAFSSRINYTLTPIQTNLTFKDTSIELETLLLVVYVCFIDNSIQRPKK